MIKIMKRSSKGRRPGDVVDSTDFLWSSRGICLVGEDVSAEQLYLAHRHGQWLGFNSHELKTSYNQLNTQEITFSRAASLQAYFFSFFPLSIFFPLVLHKEHEFITGLLTGRFFGYPKQEMFTAVDWPKILVNAHPGILLSKEAATV